MSLASVFKTYVALIMCALLAVPAVADEGPTLKRIDHSVRVKSTAPAMTGQEVELYVREVVLAEPATRTVPEDSRVVLFIHGARTPSEVAFDPAFETYSWMAYLAKEGFDVFAMDLTGHGRSTRPQPMSDPCNLPKATQAQLIPAMLKTECSPSYDKLITTLDSDWNDIGAVVDHLRDLRGVRTVALVAWSQGGPRSLGYAGLHPEKVSRVVVLAPAYNADWPTRQAAQTSGMFVFGGGVTLPSTAGTMIAGPQNGLVASWNREVEGCPGQQYDPALLPVLSAETIAADPIGATWGPGVERAPRVPYWDFNKAFVAKIQTPTLMISGAHDGAVVPERVRALYADLGAKQKVFIDLACSSHFAMWEKNHLLLFRASLDWLRDAKVSGMSQGEMKLGYAPDTADRGAKN